MQLVSRNVSRMQSLETIRNLVLPPRKKTTSCRASTTPHYTEHLHYLSLLTLSLATTSQYPLLHQICRNTNPPPPATSVIQIVNTICAEAMAKPPAITILALTKKMMTGSSLSTILMTPISGSERTYRTTTRSGERSFHTKRSTNLWAIHNSHCRTNRSRGIQGRHCQIE